VTRPLHPRRGPHNPARGTPDRRPASVRRTTTHDSQRTDGPFGVITLSARGRDLHTASDGRAAVLDTAAIHATIDWWHGCAITAIRVEPPIDSIEVLVGVPATGGFRRALDDAVPGDHGTGSLRYQLLDDLPTAVVASGYAISASGVLQPTRQDSVPSENVCAGWITGGTIMVHLTKAGLPPVVTGPAAPHLARDDDALAWHEHEPLDPHGMRRWRRLDMWLDGDKIECDAFFRDSHVDPDGTETVVHEYALSATVDRTTMRFTRCDATIGALPWVECPAALASAGRVVGAPVDGLRPWVRETFVGPPTCTHLNDALRALEDVPALAAVLATEDTGWV